MAFGPRFLRSFPGKSWVSRHWGCSWGPGSCQLGSPDSQLMGTLRFSTYCLSSQKAQGCSQAKAKGQEPGQHTSLQAAPCPALGLVLKQVQRQPSWGMGNWILRMGRPKKVQQKVSDTREPADLVPFFGHQSTIVTFLQKRKAQRKFNNLSEVKWLRELNVGFLLPNSLLSSGF